MGIQTVKFELDEAAYATKAFPALASVASPICVPYILLIPYAVATFKLKSNK